MSDVNTARVASVDDVLVLWPLGVKYVKSNEPIVHWTLTEFIRDRLIEAHEKHFAALVAIRSEEEREILELQLQPGPPRAFTIRELLGSLCVAYTLQNVPYYRTPRSGIPWPVEQEQKEPEAALPPPRNYRALVLEQRRKSWPGRQDLEIAATEKMLPNSVRVYARTHGIAIQRTMRGGTKLRGHMLEERRECWTGRSAMDIALTENLSLQSVRLYAKQHDIKLKRLRSSRVQPSLTYRLTAWRGKSVDAIIKQEPKLSERGVIMYARVHGIPVKPSKKKYTRHVAKENK